jgi:hypothetical protein
MYQSNRKENSENDKQTEGNDNEKGQCVRGRSTLALHDGKLCVWPVCLDVGQPYRYTREHP